MPSDTLDRPTPPTATPRPSTPADADPLLVRVEPDASDDSVAELVGFAIAVAGGLGRSVRLIGQHARPHEGQGPIDPVDWDLARRAEEARLAALIARHADADCALDFAVPDRFARDEIDVHDPVVVLARRGDASPWQADDALRRFLTDGPGSVLVVPACAAERTRTRIARIVIPLDGSARAECALPCAFAIARRHAAELVLVHVPPESPLTAAGALDADTRALADALSKRNLRAADAYLASLRARHADVGVTLRTRLLEPGDARRRLVDVAEAERADLIVVAAHGASGHVNVASGTVATYVLEHASAPVLMVGAGARHDAQARDAGREQRGPRPPAVSNGRR